VKPRTTATLQEHNIHPKRPDELRIEQLKEPWDDRPSATTATPRGREECTIAFDTSCAMQPPQLFNKDPSYEKSIFIPGMHRLKLQLLSISTHSSQSDLQVVTSFWCRAW
jgi:hypothetical protein